MTRFDGMAAAFLVDDIGATARWYRDLLGFVFDTFPLAEPFEWASLRRGRAEIMLQRSPGYQKPDLDPLRPGGAWNAYFYVDNADALFATLDKRATVRRAPCDQPYKMREFEIADPNGYVLVFGQDLSGQGAE
jgi:catechol 2,3-dioxygenase-like lactoylglutathione lyase family enzyme